MNKRTLFFLLPFFFGAVPFALKAMEPGNFGAARFKSDTTQNNLPKKQTGDYRQDRQKTVAIETNGPTGSNRPLSPQAVDVSLSAPASAKVTPRIVQENLEKAQQAILESLAHCDAASVGFFSDLWPFKSVLMELQKDQQAALDAWNKTQNKIENPDYQKHSRNIDQHLKALEKILEMEEPSNEEVGEDDNVIDADIELGTLNRVPLINQETVSTEQLEECQKIRNKILSTVVPFDHRDPLHASKWTVSDGVTFPLVLPIAFEMPISDSAMAGLAANVVGTLTASPWLFDRATRTASRLLPGRSYESWRQTLEKMSAFFRQKIADSDYLGYYLTGWYFLKIVNKDPECLKWLISSNRTIGSGTREATLLASFIVPSALARKATSRLIQSEFCRNPLMAEAEIITQSEPGRSASWEACRGVIARFLPDIVAAATRSFLSNLYDHSQGKITLDQVCTKTVYSAGVYTVATMMFFSLYRLAEVVMWRAQPTQAYYQKFAAEDAKELQKLKETLSSISTFDENCSQDKKMPSQNSGLSSFSNDSSLQRASVKSLSPHALATLSHSLQLLNSPVANFLGDPIYRMTSKNNLNAFRAVDAIKLLKRVIPSLTSSDVIEQKEACAALNRLSHYLLDSQAIESGERSSGSVTQNGNERSPLVKRNRAAFDENKIDALIRLFITFSENDSLLNAARPPAGYEAVGRVDDNVLGLMERAKS